MYIYIIIIILLREYHVCKFQLFPDILYDAWISANKAHLCADTNSNAGSDKILSHFTANCDSSV